MSEYHRSWLFDVLKDRCPDLADEIEMLRLDLHGALDNAERAIKWHVAALEDFA